MEDMRDRLKQRKWTTVLLMVGLTSFAFSYATPARQQIAVPSLSIIGFDWQLTNKQLNWQYLGQGYRAYNPMLHRLMSQDSMSPFSKGGLNGYVFSANNPVMSYDPSGHFAISDLFPTTWPGWLAFGATAGVAGVIGTFVSVMATAPFSLVAGAVLSGAIGGVSNAIGAYVGQGLTTHRWGLDWQSGGHLAIAFSVGVVSGMMTTGLVIGGVKYNEEWSFGMSHESAGLGSSSLSGWRDTAVHSSPAFSEYIAQSEQASVMYGECNQVEAPMVNEAPVVNEAPNMVLETEHKTTDPRQSMDIAPGIREVEDDLVDLQHLQSRLIVRLEALEAAARRIAEPSDFGR